jgi:hypothetical protein
MYFDEKKIFFPLGWVPNFVQFHVLNAEINVFFVIDVDGF